jgi:hypothetical protein
MAEGQHRKSSEWGHWQKQIRSWRNPHLDKHPICRGLFTETPINLDKINFDNFSNLLFPILDI